MLTIRFERTGRRNKAQFRVVLQEHTTAPGGRHIEVLGSYDPHQKKAVLKADRIKYWISKGAQPSESAHNLFIKESVIEGKKKAIKMERPKAKEVPAEVKEEKVEEPKAEEVKAEAEEPKTEEKPAE